MVDRRLSRNDTAEGEILLKVRLRRHHRRHHPHIYEHDFSGGMAVFSFWQSLQNWSN